MSHYLSTYLCLLLSRTKRALAGAQTPEPGVVVITGGDHGGVKTLLNNLLRRWVYNDVLSEKEKKAWEMEVIIIGVNPTHITYAPHLRLTFFHKQSCDSVGWVKCWSWKSPPSGPVPAPVRCVVYLVDASTAWAVWCAKTELWKHVLREKDFEGCRLVVLASWQDVETAISPEEVITELELNKIQDRPWAIYPFCSLRYDEQTPLSDLPRGDPERVKTLSIMREEPFAAQDDCLGWFEERIVRACL